MNSYELIDKIYHFCAMQGQSTTADKIQGYINEFNDQDIIKKNFGDNIPLSYEIINDICRYSETINKYDRQICHYDNELKAYKKLTDDIEDFIKRTLDPNLAHRYNNIDNGSYKIFNDILLKIETFKKEHPEYSDENPVEFNDEES